MIATLTGRLATKAPTFIILDVQGVGYEVSIPLSSYYSLPDVDQTLSLTIHTRIKDDTIQLFGFTTMEEKNAFLLLTGVSGIGPKLALSVLSALSVSDLTDAIQRGDLETLFAVPGVGKKTAARMALELKDKVLCETSTPQGSRKTERDGQEQLIDDALSALVNLGYRSQDGKKILQHLTRENSSGLQLKDLIRSALKELSGGKIP